MSISEKIYIKRRFVVRSLHDRIAPAKNRFDIREICHENIADAAWFNTPEQLDCFHQFLENGYKGYFVYIEGEVAHRIWIFTDSKRSILAEGFVYKIEPNVIVAWVLTSEKYRGKGIYPHMLAYLKSVFRPKFIYGVVEPENFTSIKGFLKTGFEIYQKFVLIRFYRIKLWVQYQKQGKLSFRLGIGSVVS
ncbi:MAG TPA: hypothetical protein PK990_06900 [Salinivirgaceae bacterium]|nr:hypothetical protein [Salinivirgaceae bacterium]